jgi:hypothetical protein
MGPLCSSGSRATAQHAHLLRRHCIDVLFLMFIIYFFIKLKMTCSSLIWIYTWHYLFHCLGIPISEFTQWHYLFHCLGIPISEFTQWHYLFHCLGIPISEFTQWHYLFHCLGIPISEFTQWHYLFLCLGIPISEFTQSDLAANSVCYLHTSTEEIYMDSFTFSVTDGKNQVIYYLSSNISKNIKN